ncbi:alpha/beta hydrolase-fold protein [Niabella yanshanensis]|uniref:Alpha/beta hydrolase-fold protein n=1 Tax=Niabella yanshanensis TaxID=577386 RepID=A0ABZ0W3L8_9BACT|nr:alpha/beta hydrolase-fold protein [Niabella yanshanensis]WQD37865.1 alpha/beta hydrolase-fold protein [Niabella yanshanensis]
MKSVYYCLLLSLVVLAACSDTSAQPDPVPVHETFFIESKNVKEKRTINVWTPPGYSVVTDSFAVVYMPDGGVKEDFPHIANTLAELIAAQKIPAVILVGIENTQRRRDMSGPTQIKKDKEIAPVVGGSAAFRTFVKDELFREVDKRYRTTGKKTIIGESLAGLFVVETFFQHPELFDGYIAIDPSLWWNDHQLVKNAKNYLSTMPESKRLWFAGSQAKDISRYTQQLSGILETTGVKDLQWHYSDEPKEQHQTIFRAVKEKALIWTLSK